MARLGAALDKLDRVESIVIRCRLRGVTRQEIGVALGCSREWVRLIEGRAVGELRRELRCGGGGG